MIILATIVEILCNVITAPYYLLKKEYYGIGYEDRNALKIFLLFWSWLIFVFIYFIYILVTE